MMMTSARMTRLPAGVLVGNTSFPVYGSSRVVTAKLQVGASAWPKLVVGFADGDVGVANSPAGGVTAARTLKTFSLSAIIKPDPATTIVVSNRLRVVFDM